MKLTKAQREECFVRNSAGESKASIARSFGVKYDVVVEAIQKTTDPLTGTLNLGLVDYAPIARAEGISAHAVQNHERRALKKLKKLLLERGLTFEDFAP